MFNMPNGSSGGLQCFLGDTPGRQPPFFFSTGCRRLITILSAVPQRTGQVAQLLAVYLPFRANLFKPGKSKHTG